MSLPIFFVHGYRYDPDNRGRNNPHDTIYKRWKAELPGQECLEFSYYSAPGWKGHVRAWMNGYRNSYRWAYSKLAVKAAYRLAHVAALNTGDSNIICHSLGSRVALMAIELGAPIKTCIIMSGAEMVDVAVEIAADNPDTTFYNCYSKADGIIDYIAENFTPGGPGEAIGNDGIVGLKNWHNIVLDNKRVKAWAQDTHRWNLRGSVPGESGEDHEISYRWYGNWQMYRAMVEGVDLQGLPDVN